MNEIWKAIDLIARLKKQYAAATQIKTGDIVITEDDAWEVEEVHKNPNGFLTILNKDGGGFMEIAPTTVVVIIDRICYG